MHVALPQCILGMLVLFVHDILTTHFSSSLRNSSRTVMTLNLLFENPQAESVVAKLERQAWSELHPFA